MPQRLPKDLDEKGGRLEPPQRHHRPSRGLELQILGLSRKTRPRHANCRSLLSTA